MAHQGRELRWQMKIPVRTILQMFYYQLVLLVLLTRDMDSSLLSSSLLSNNKLHYVNYDCASSDFSYSAGSNFESALNYTLFTVLPTNASVASFCSFFTPRIGSDDQIYAHFYCRGDVDSQVCHDCVEAAALTVAQQCRFLKQGIVWYQECTLRYANQTLVDENESPIARLYNYSSILSSYYLDLYVPVFNKFMNSLLNQAAYNASLHGFATSLVNLSSSQPNQLILRGLVQCSPDIGGASCDHCLRAALRQRDSWSNTMIFLPSCLVRFDVYGSPEPSQASSSPSSGSRKHSIVITVPVVVGAISLLLVGFLLNRVYKGRKHQHNQGSTSRLSRFAYSEVTSMTNGFQRQLGIGSFGIVYYGSLTNGREVAVKMLSLLNPNYEQFAREQFKTEVRVLGGTHHSNLVSLIGYCEEDANLGLVYEYMAGGNLRDALAGPNPLSWKERVDIAIDAAQGLVYLHGSRPSIIHRDVKTTNILLDEHLRAKIADFGVAKIFPDEYQREVFTRVMGTPGYLDPEYHVSGQLNEKSDVYSFGVVLLELITGKDAIISGDEAEERLKLIKWVRARVNDDQWDIGNVLDSRLQAEVTEKNYCHSVGEATKFALRCVDTAAERPTMTEVLAHLKNLVSWVHIDPDPRNSCGSSNSSWHTTSTGIIL